MPPPVQHTTIINNNSGGSSGWNGLTGFMLGSAMSSHNNDRPYNGGGYNTNGGLVGSTASPGISNNAVPVQAESAGTSALRVFAWLALLAALGGGTWYLVKYFTKPASPKPHRYTL
jgi:hypothetical protein